LLIAGCARPVADDGSAATAKEGEQGPERSVQLPLRPKNENLVFFDTGPTSAFKFYVDSASLSVERDDGVVRFTVVAKTDTAANVTYEGFRCMTRERKLYAYGRLDGTWRAVSDPTWEKLGTVAGDGYRQVLYWNYFCAPSAHVRTAAEALNALKLGGHPYARPNWSPAE
jgi:hypothetical protein